VGPFFYEKVSQEALFYYLYVNGKTKEINIEILATKIREMIPPIIHTERGYSIFMYLLKPSRRRHF